jgi:hypothetical protein
MNTCYKKMGNLFICIFHVQLKIKCQQQLRNPIFLLMNAPKITKMAFMIFALLSLTNCVVWIKTTIVVDVLSLLSWFNVSLYFKVAISLLNHNLLHIHNVMECNTHIIMEIYTMQCGQTCKYKISRK